MEGEEGGRQRGTGVRARRRRTSHVLIIVSDIVVLVRPGAVGLLLEAGAVLEVDPLH